MIREVELRGGPRARGVAHGRALAADIIGHLADWLASLPELDGGGDAYARALLRDTDFRTAVATHCPDLLEETRGIAEGAGLDPDLVFALQLLDEEWAYRVRRRAAARPLEKCSSVAIACAEGPTWIGQNMDLGAYTDGRQVVLRLGPDGREPGALLFSTAGLIGLLGVNAAGVAVCVNSIPQLPSAPEGIPVAFMIRRLLQARSLDAAVEVVLTLPHATNQHYLLAEAGRVRAFECGAAGVTEHHGPDRDRVLHTNHPLTAAGEPEPEAARENSVRRLASLTRRLAAGAPTLTAIQAALSSRDDPAHPVSREYAPDAGLIGFTTGSMISELRAGAHETECWVSPGPPSREGYTRLTLAAEARG